MTAVKETIEKKASVAVPQGKQFQESYFVWELYIASKASIRERIPTYGLSENN